MLPVPQARVREHSGAWGRPFDRGPLPHSRQRVETIATAFPWDRRLDCQAYAARFAITSSIVDLTDI